MKLNSSQLQSVQHLNGPMLTLAGPGSGKTHVLIKRIKYLITECRVRPDRILVVTFSRAAANEMEERFLKSIRINELSGKRPLFGTFHSIFFGILKETFKFTSENIISEKKKSEILEREILKSGYESDNEDELFKNLINEISNVKGNLTDISSFSSSIVPDELFAKLFRAYNKYLRENMLFDFDDMLMFTYKLLRERPDILKCWQQKYEYILVDEFQDINTIQYETIKLLSPPENNLFVVGDDDQSIYGFRGARPEIMERFLKDFPGCKRSMLNVNYRCPAPVITASQKIIKRNRNRFSKNIVPGKPGLDESFYLTRFHDRTEEADEIIKTTKDYLSYGISASEIAILFRNNSDYGYLSSKLSKAGLPVICENSASVDKYGFIKSDITAYMHLACNDYTRSDFLKVMNKPYRKLSREAVSEENIFHNLKRYYKGSLKIPEIINTFEHQLKFMKDMTPYAALKYILDVLGYRKYLYEYIKRSDLDQDEANEYLNDLIELSKKCSSLPEFAMSLKSMKSNNSKAAQGIRLMTMHASKGLEFDVVFIPGLNSGYMPNKKAKKPSEIEEERRILYVAMTRTKKALHMSYLEISHGKPSEKSIFIENL